MLNLFRSWRCRPSFPLRHSSTISLNRASYKDNQNRKRVENVPPTSLHGLQITSFKRQLALYLINRRFRSAEVFFHSALWESKEDHITRSQLYEHATMAFLRFGDEPRALNLFHRMTQDGFIPSHELYIVMNFLKHGSKADTDSELFDFMNWIQSLPPGMLDEAVFQPILQIANRLMYTNPTVIQVITKKLREERPLSNHICSLLSEFYAKKGKLDLAAEWSSTEGNVSLSAQTSDEAAQLSSQAASKTTPPQHSTSPHEFMMAKLAKKDYQGLFDSYRTWRSLGSPSILPNSLLFAVMFRTIATLESSTPRDRRPRELKLPYKMIPLRDLFYDMLECHSLQSIGQAAVESSSSPVHSRSLTTVSLTAALRSFMRVRDYAGAFIVVKSFQLFRIPLPHSIYETIVFSILHRIKRELSFIDQTSSPEDIWAYRFLNYPELPLDGNLDLEEVIASMAYRTYPSDAGKTSKAIEEKKDNGGMDDGKKKKHGDVPHVARLRGLVSRASRTVHLPERSTFYPYRFEIHRATLALLRILRQAILASTLPGHLPPGKEVGLEIAVARSEMVPSFRKPTSVKKKPVRK